MDKKSIIEDTRSIYHALLQPQIMKYLVIVVDRGITSEVYCFNSLKDARRAFGEIAHDYGYTADEINGSDYYNVSIWEWIGGRYQKIYYHE